jgi:signal transduction histidine kinase
MVMDDRRFIWMTTEGGLVRYDGQKFKIYNKSTTDFVGNDRFRWIIKTTSGEILTDDLSGKTYLIKDGRFELLKEDSTGVLAAPHLAGYLPNRKFYLKVKRRELPFFQTDSIADSPYTILDYKNGVYFIKYLNGLLEYSGDALIHKYPLVKSIDFIAFRIQNTLMYFDQNKNIKIFDTSGKTSLPVQIKGDLSENSLKSIQTLNDVVWNPGYSEVYFKLELNLFKISYDYKSLTLNSELIISNLPENCSVTDVIYDDVSGCYFLGTDTKGFYIYKKQQFKTLINPVQNNSVSNTFYSQAAIDSHRVYGGFNREADESGIYKSTLDIGNNQIEAMHSTAFQKIYYSIGDMLISHNLQTGQKIVLASGDKNNYHAFYQEGDSIFVASRHFVGYIKNDSLYKLCNRKLTSAEYKTDDIIRGPDGLLWLATCKGVYRMTSDYWDLLPVKGLERLCARKFKTDGKRIYIGTYGQGLHCWENDKLTKFPADKNKFMNHVHSFYTDSHDFIWFSTNNGIVKAPWKSIQNYTEDDSNPVTYYYYGEGDGIINTEFNGGCSPPYVALRNGFLSYPTMEGLVWFKPDEIRHNLPAGVPLIDEIIVNGKKTDNYTLISVPPASENVTIRLSMPYFGKADNIYLQYKLEGLNKDWVNISPEEMKISFTNLTSGIHQLQIRNLTGYHSNSESEISIVFDVEKRYYETAWFRLLAVSVMAMILFLIFKMNNSRIIRKNLALEAKISERTAELQEVNSKLKENLGKLEKQETELKESIQLKNRLISVISHDIITPLKFISMVSRHSKKGITDAEKHLKTMQDIEFASERLHNNASNILNWIKIQNQRIVPEKIHIALHELAEECMEPIRGMASLRKVELRNSIPEETIIKCDKNILAIILQNLLTNSVKYTEKGIIEITASESNSDVIIKVTDTGIGMTEESVHHIRKILEGKNTVIKSDETTDLGNRLGYYIISDLLKYINGIIQIESHHGKGTSVSLRLD